MTKKYQIHPTTKDRGDSDFPVVLVSGSSLDTDVDPPWQSGSVMSADTSMAIDNSIASPSEALHRNDRGSPLRGGNIRSTVKVLEMRRICKRIRP